VARILFLVHRLPYPLNKGDKVRSYYLLCRLAAQYEVYMGIFVDDPGDEVHVLTVRQWCREIHVSWLHPARARAASLAGLGREQPLTLTYCRDAGLDQWVQNLRERRVIDYFAPNPARTSPFATGELTLVFTGAMDYWANIDAVTWFVQRMLPKLRLRWSSLRLHTFGRSPPLVVTALAGDAVEVTRTVPDRRPYLQHAAALVAPLLGDRTCADVIGRAARQQVRVRFGWPAQLAALNRWLNITGYALRAA
jgi:hypothetical protein